MDRPKAPWFWDQWVRGLTPSEAASTYRRLDWSTSMLNGVDNDPNRTKSFDADGDHLTIARVTGSLPVYVRFRDSDPGLRVFSRMVITRPFRKVIFSHGNQRVSVGSQSNGEARVVAYSSHGPLIAQFPPKEFGLRRAPLMLRSLTATTTHKDVMEYFINAAVSSTDQAGLSTGLEGGTVVILNTDAANDLFLSNMITSAPLVGLQGFGPLKPGQSVTLQLDDIVSKYANQKDDSGLGVFTLVGTCQFSMMFSNGEGSDTEGLVDAEHTPSLR